MVTKKKNLKNGSKNFSQDEEKQMTLSMERSKIPLCLEKKTTMF